MFFSDRGFFLCRYLIAILFEVLLGLEYHCVGCVDFVHALSFGLVGCFVGFCLVTHALDLYEEDARQGDAYDAVYCVFDRDKHTTFGAAVQRTKDCQAPLIAITSTPCFEVWLLLHFGYTDQPFHAAGKKSVGDQVVAQLKRKPGMGQYGKGQQGIYVQLKDKLDSALNNADRLRQHGKDTGSINPATDVDQLVLTLQTLVR